jgi:hypothetical protein
VLPGYVLESEGAGDIIALFNIIRVFGKGSGTQPRLLEWCVFLH